MPSKRRRGLYYHTQFRGAQCHVACRNSLNEREWPTRCFLYLHLCHAPDSVIIITIIIRVVHQIGTHGNHFDFALIDLGPVRRKWRTNAVPQWRMAMKSRRAARGPPSIVHQLPCSSRTAHCVTFTLSAAAVVDQDEAESTSPAQVVAAAAAALVAAFASSSSARANTKIMTSEYKNDERIQK